MAYRAAISAHCPHALQPESTQRRVIAFRRSPPKSEVKSAIFSDRQAMRSFGIVATAQRAAAILAPYSRAKRSISMPTDLFGTMISPTGDDQSLRAVNRQLPSLERINLSNWLSSAEASQCGHSAPSAAGGWVKMSRARAARSSANNVLIGMDCASSAETIASIASEAAMSRAAGVGLASSDASVMAKLIGASAVNINPPGVAVSPETGA